MGFLDPKYVFILLETPTISWYVFIHTYITQTTKVLTWHIRNKCLRENLLLHRRQLLNTQTFYVFVAGGPSLVFLFSLLSVNYVFFI